MGIHDQNYVTYEGKLESKLIPRAIAWNGFVTYWGFLRTKLILILLGISPLVALIAVIVEYSAMNTSVGALVTGNEAPGATGISAFVSAQLFCLALLFLASCCGVISDDLRYRTFQLYFSKPLNRMEYALGKLGGLFLIGSLVTIVPVVGIFALRMAIYARTPHLWAITGKMAVGFGALILGQLVLSLLLMGLSSLTRSTRYVVLSWLGVLIVPGLIGATVFIAADSPPWAGLIGLLSCASMMVDVVLSPEDFENVPKFAPYLVMLLWGGLGAGLLAKRVKQLDGVA